MTDLFSSLLYGERPPDLGIYTGPAQALATEMPPDSMDFCFTDPVYKDLGLYKWLAETCMRVLKPGRSCLTFYAGPNADKVKGVFQEAGMRYVWELSHIYLGRTSRLRAYGLNLQRTPLLWFYRPLGRKWRRPLHPILDVYIERTPPPKGKHKWYKGAAGLLYYLTAFAAPGEVVFDPFCGHGTIECVAKMSGRSWLAFEIDPDNAKKARAAVAKTGYYPHLLHPWWEDENNDVTADVFTADEIASLPMFPNEEENDVA